MPLQHKHLRQDPEYAKNSIKPTCVVVFGDDNCIPWFRWLAPGYRHCFVAIATGSNWVIIDPLAHQTVIESIPLSSADALSNWYRQHGYSTIITGQRTSPAKPAPWAPFTCVEAVKRILGIQHYWVQTPKQLFKYLKNENNP